MFETLKNAFKVKEIRRKILITLAFLFVYRLGCYIPVPGIASSTWQDNFTNPDTLSYLNIMSMMTGGALQYGSLFAMGIGPYINASIILQLLCVAIPSLEALSKQGEEGRKKIAQITRYITIVLAVIQSVGVLVSYNTSFVSGTDTSLALGQILVFGNKNLYGFGNVLAYIFVIIIFTAGTCITMWIGERITDYGVSNGISILIFAGVIASAGIAVTGMVKGWIETSFDVSQFWNIFFFAIVIVLIFGCIVAVDLAERKIPVQYAKQIKGNKMYGGQSTSIPIKVNANGVMPLIFAFSILSFPELIISMFWNGSGFHLWWATWLGSQSQYPFYSIVLCLLVLFFAFFYSQIQFNPDDISKSIQQNGGFIPGIRPGKPTAEHLRKISNRITLFGAIFLALMALVPSLIFSYLIPTASGAFSATGLLIVVSVALEFNQQLEAQIMMKQYKGFLK